MDSDLENQIDELIYKSTKDLKTRICRVVNKHLTKSLKAQAKELRAEKTQRRGRQSSTSSF